MSIANKFRLLKKLCVYEEGAKGNTDLAGQIVFEFSEKEREQIIKDWAKTPTGLRYLAGERLTDNIERFKDRDPNTLGAKYLQFLEKYDFTEVNDQLATTQARYDEAAYSDHQAELKAYGTFVTDMHDFTHVITGYPPDTFGELMRIRVYRQYEGRGWAVLYWNGWIKAQFRKSQERKYFNAAVREARRTEKTAKNYIFEDMFSMLGWHINKVRKNLSTPASKLWNWEMH
tara:strand:- start:3200 stop:3889 length:690 start_codon:yes stop_codon:yes gene_type:complete